MKSNHVCIVTPGYLASTPRVVKEADALAAAGLSVRVVHGAGDIAEQRAMDRDLAAGKPWGAHAVDWSAATPAGRRLRSLARLRHHFWSRLPERLLRAPRRVALAYGRIVPELARAAASAPADLYVGHYPDGLAAAASAAAGRGRLGFDAEDLHGAEYDDRAGPGPRDRLASRLLDAWLPRCAHVTASSRPIAEALALRHRLSAVAAVHNAFPLSERPSSGAPARDRDGDGPSLYWFSQYIGGGRGLEDVVLALRDVRRPWRLHLRGVADPRHVALLRDLLGPRAADLRVHPYAPPGEMIARAAEHDLGLATEAPTSLSRRLCATNKLFTYYVAGIGIVATDLPGQRSVIDATPGAAVSYRSGDHAALAARLDALLHPAPLAAIKAASAAGARHWNWERESAVLVESALAALRRPVAS